MKTANVLPQQNKSAVLKTTTTPPQKWRKTGQTFKRSSLVVRVAEETKKEADIYLGYDAEKQTPKYVKDDPSKYPNKEDSGFFLGVTGGWAGGESGLWKFKDDWKNKKSESAETQAAIDSQEIKIAKELEGSDNIYIGFGKDQIQEKNTGTPGYYIKDDARRYPDKEDLGFMIGATGGFAGGEVGLKEYVESGKVEVGSERRKQFSPLIVAFLVVVVGGGGGAGLFYVLDLLKNQLS